MEQADKVRRLGDDVTQARRAAGEQSGGDYRHLKDNNDVIIRRWENCRDQLHPKELPNIQAFGAVEGITLPHGRCHRSGVVSSMVH